MEQVVIGEELQDTFRAVLRPFRDLMEMTDSQETEEVIAAVMSFTVGTLRLISELIVDIKNISDISVEERAQALAIIRDILTAGKIPTEMLSDAGIDLDKPGLTA